MKGLFSLTLSQRYYHFVAIKAQAGLNLNDFWRDCGIAKGKDNFADLEQGDYVIHHIKYVTDHLYYEGVDDLSLNEDRKPPYQYDIFGVYIKQSNTIVVGFPFKSMARSILNIAIKKNRLMRGSDFIRPLLDRLVQLKADIQNGEPISPLETEFFTASISGIGLALSGDIAISQVNLNGKQPLASPIFKTFQTFIEGKTAKVSSCLIKSLLLEQDETLPRTRSFIHMDTEGHFKMYIHESGNNIMTVPFLFKVLLKNKCLKSSSINPIN